MQFPNMVQEKNEKATEICKSFAAAMKASEDLDTNGFANPDG